VNGGDIRGLDGLEVWKMIGATLRKYDPRHLITYHPRGRYSSSEWFQKEGWLDFNMIQSGHRTYAQDTSANEKNHFGEDNWKYINVDYHLLPVKPVLDGEPSYENIPHGLHDYSLPRWTADDVRRYAYWSVFAGGAGFTYGENSVMQFHNNGDKDANYGVNMNWEQTINATGARQMHYLKELMLSTKSYFDRIPAQEIILGNTGTKYDYLLATRGKDYIMVYTYTGKPVQLKMGVIAAKELKAQWYNPRTGKSIGAGIHSNKGTKEFRPPSEEDWVLVLEK
jgi:Protein of unknown function (DUF4038)/Putative collagen-binding domain of a collagenase